MRERMICNDGLACIPLFGVICVWRIPPSCAPAPHPSSFFCLYDSNRVSAWLSVLLSMLEPRIPLPRGWEFLCPCMPRNTYACSASFFAEVPRLAATGQSGHVRTDAAFFVAVDRTRKSLRHGDSSWNS